MQLTLFTDYSLRVLMYLSQRPNDLSTMKEMSEFYQISTEHLRKVIHSLARKGYIKSFRGKHGGVKLARPSAEIVIGDVVKNLEGGLSIIDCAGRECLLDPDCMLKRALYKAMRAFYQELDQYTLADIVADTGIQRQLGVIASG